MRDDDEVPIYKLEKPCRICGGEEYYSIQYQPDKIDSYKVCSNCGAFLGDEIVSKE